MSLRQDWRARPGRALSGSAVVPGDKSVSHRAVMLAALADGDSRIHGFLEGEDTRATAAAFAAMGVAMETPGAGERRVRGVGLHGLAAPSRPIDCGNAGTAMRLLAGLLAGQAFDSELTGDASLSRRPMGRVVEPLARMGAAIETRGGLPPLWIRGGQPLHGLDYTPPVASAQVKSAVLLAGLYARGATTVREPRPTRDYTERMLAAFGCPVRQEGGAVTINGGARLRATDIAVPADFSSAAFLIVAASLVPGSDLLLPAVGLNPRRTGLLEALRLMGADIAIEAPRSNGLEPVGDLRVRHAPLRGIAVPEALVADMIDEFPVLFVAAALAGGETRVSAAAELRVKESDRIAVMAAGLRALGVGVDEQPDGAVIHGSGGRALSGGEVESHGDHRIAMSFAVAAQCASAPVRIRDVANVATSFPGFDTLARSLGFGLEPADPVA
jgi:3-phosphoshikimate 1-carboxyvinyltransferase